MARVIKIQKIGKSTIVEIIDGTLGTPVVHVFNKPADLGLRNNVIEVYSSNIRLSIQYDEIFNKLSSSDIKDYLEKAAALNFFNQ